MAAPVAQTATLDGIAMRDIERLARPRSYVASRRSVSSIFSRKGIEIPEPDPPFIVQAAMPIATPMTKPMTQKQKSWLSRRRSTQPSRSDPPGRSETILNTVPPAQPVQITSLEQCVTTWMANATTGQVVSTPGASPVSATPPTKSFFKSSTIVRAQRNDSAKREETLARIGLWVNGVVRLDDDNDYVGGRTGREEPNLHIEPRFTTPCVPVRTSSKPLLSVLIPGGKLAVNDQSSGTATVCRTRSLVSAMAPPSIMTKYGLTTPRSSEDHIVSPLESDSPQALPVSPQGRPKNSPQTRLTMLPTRERSTSSSESIPERDDTSTHSNKSSATSIEETAVSATVENPAGRLSIVPNINKPLPPPPTSPSRRAAAGHPPSPSSKQWLHVGSHGRSVSTPQANNNSFIVPSTPRTVSLIQLESLDRAFEMTAPRYPLIARPLSPTLSEAEDELEAHLCTIARSSIYSQENMFVSDLATRDLSSSPMWSAFLHPGHDVRNAMHTPEPTPSLPKRSRKREWHNLEDDRNDATALSPSRRRSETDLAGLSPQAQGVIPIELRRSPSVCIPPTRDLSYADCISAFDDDEVITISPAVDDGLIVVSGPTTMSYRRQQIAAVSATSAEQVLLQIMSMLTSMDDLFHTAIINRGMYRVYKDNELQLLRTVLRNQSPAASEFRDWSPPLSTVSLEFREPLTQLDYTAKSYLQCHRRDLDVVKSLELRIVSQCRLLVRPETARILAAGTYPDVQRFDDALWRIWSFCSVFGSRKGRETDVTGQLDWLKGGILAHNQDLTATTNINLDFDMISVLLNAPEFFAAGNEDGLIAEQLYDILEMWNCLRVMLQGYHDRTVEARGYGVFDDVDVTGEDEEEVLLEEWTAHLMTLGPAVILQMAEHAREPSSAGFALAQANGWTEWSFSLDEGSQRAFLKEPISRLYDERISAASPGLQKPREKELKEQSRKRVANLAAEIKLARKASGYMRLPVIDMSQEQPMSAVSRSNSVMSPISPNTAASSILQRRAAARTAQAPRLPVPVSKSSLPAPRPSGSINPIIEEAPGPLDLSLLRRFGMGIAEDTSDRALKRIVAMGFPAAAARDALRTTDTGDGLRVDRAVDVLLGRQ